MASLYTITPSLHEGVGGEGVIYMDSHFQLWHHKDCMSDPYLSALKLGKSRVKTMKKLEFEVLCVFPPFPYWSWVEALATYW